MELSPTHDLVASPSPSAIIAQINIGHQALVEARNDFERLQVRDVAKALEVAAGILQRREVQVEASMLVMDAERAIAKANPSQQGKRPAGMPGSAALGGETIKKVRQAHAYLDDDEYREIKIQARDEMAPLTRKRLNDIGRKKHKEENRAEIVKRRMEKGSQEPSLQCDLHHCSINDLIPNGHVQPGSLDLIVTDPPYDRGAIPLFGDLSAFAAEALKPGGSLLCMSGTVFWREQLDTMERAAQGTDFIYWWTMVYDMSTTNLSGLSRAFSRKTFILWKPIFWFVRGKYEGEWVKDLVQCRSASLEK